MKTSISLNGQMFVADVQKEKKGERQGAYHFVARVADLPHYGYGDTPEEAADDLRTTMNRSR